MREIQGDLCHRLLRARTTPLLSFDESKDFDAWRAEVKEKLCELAGIYNIQKNACPLRVEIEEETQKEGYKQIRFTFESERGAFVPCYLLVPDTGKKKYPLAITLQGHSSGFHLSVGEPKETDDKTDDYVTERGAFAVQAVERGFVALAIEQRGMGERRPNGNHQKAAAMCEYTAHIALLLGRTILGERIWDVSKAIDAVEETFDCVDMDKILVTGSSGGGTASFYAACYDERIKLSAPACAFCSYETSIMDWYHCSCNFIPHAYEWFEMQDLACLISPRNLIVATGETDPIFPIDGVRESFKAVEKIYARAGVPDRCKMVETPQAHYWNPEAVWGAIEEEIAKLGWK